MSDTSWVDVCAVDDIDEEDVIRFDHGDDTFAVYRTESGYYATAGLCTHEQVHLADGLVLDEIIECPMHQGQFHIPSGDTRGGPVCVNIKTYPVKVDGDRVLLNPNG